MRLSLYIAKRYLFSKKSINAINIISFISVVGVLVSSAALVIVLSFYNGMEQFILSMYSNFAPELRIEPSKGKSFLTDNDTFKAIRNNEDIFSYTEVLEDKVLVEHNSYQFIATLKGIEITKESVGIYNKMLYSGNFESLTDSIPYCILGAQVQANLQVNFQDPNNYIKLYSPRKSNTESVNPMNNLNIRQITPKGILSYEQGFDNLIITPISFAKDILDEYDKVSAIEIHTKEKVKIARLQKQLQKELGENYVVKNRQQQNPTLYKTVRSEKWIVFFIMTIIGVIAIFNIIGSITMLVIDKKEDMKVLVSLGATDTLIQRIFFLEGMIISFIGSILGIAIGYSFCRMQEIFGFVRTNDLETSMIDIYPVDIRLNDFILVFFTILIASSAVSYISSKLSLKGLHSDSLSLK